MYLFIAAGTAGIPHPVAHPKAEGFAAADALFAFAAAETAATQRKRRIERGIDLQQQFVCLFPSALPVINLATGQEINPDPNTQQQRQQEAQMMQQETLGFRDRFIALYILQLQVLGMRIQALQRDILVIGKP